ncbi:hypothetical protein LCGC14_1424460 [marine sediment metagenome]|uniref:Uncharacterized protein n=1 Tax=marine sediment metagenome TaxID=412755 RepID=A0A0F9M5V5_9ZZZZ
MPFDPGRMDDPNPDVLEQFAQSVKVTEEDLRRIMDLDQLRANNQTWDDFILKFADWCFDQGFVEGTAEADMRHEQGSG